MANPLVALTMIVKNEAPTIAATLASAGDAVDLVVILDTGSTDKTKDLIVEYFDDVSMAAEPYPGGKWRGAHFGGPVFECVLREEQFADFATTRNRVLAIHAEQPDAAVFSLMLSGGEILHGGPSLRAFLADHRDSAFNAFNVEVRYGDSLRFFYPHVLRVGGPWRYEGTGHEVPVNPDNPDDPAPIIPGCWIEHAVDPPEELLPKLRDRNLPLLMADLAAAKTDRAKARVLMHIAQTYDMLANLAPKDEPGGEFLTLTTAAMGYYLRRVEMGGYPDEVLVARLGYLNNAAAIGTYTPTEMLRQLAPLDGNRPEVAYMVAAYVEKARGPSDGYRAAVEAVRVAKASHEQVMTLTPVDLSCLWRSHLIAARCARALGWEADARKHAAAGVAAGKTGEAFEEYVR